MAQTALDRARLGAAAIDEAVIALVAAVLLAMAVQTGAVAVLAVGMGALLSPLGPARGAVAVSVVVTLWLLTRLAYGVVAEGGPRGATPGKRLAGLSVQGPAGEPCGYRRALVRQTVKALALVSLAGVLAAATGRWWHDAVAGTSVVPASEAAAGGQVRSS